jgi:hypothetical protein
MMHFNGSKTHECKDCGSRLIEDNQCLTCDSVNLKHIEEENKMKKRDVATIWTYGTHESDNDTDFGISFDVPKKWLKEKVKAMGYSSLAEFCNDYTWDTTASLNIEAENENVLINRKCGKFGHELYKK